MISAFRHVTNTAAECRSVAARARYTIGRDTLNERPPSGRVSDSGPSMLDTSTYEKGIEIADKEMKAFEARHLQRHDFHGDWN